MKRLFLSILLAGLGMFATHAQTPAGYAIFGEVPYGYTDLRDNIEVSIPAVISGQDIQSSSIYSAPIDQNSLIFTGNGLSGGNACQNYAALSIRLKSDQTLTLTEGMVIHLKIKRSDENSSGLMRISMHKNTWGNGGRLTFEISNTDLTSSVSELLCAYNSPLNWSWSTNGQANLIGTQTYYGGAGKEFFRFEAASGEAFEITQIYIDADATKADPVSPDPGDEDAPTGLTLAESNIRDRSVTLTASADDAASLISYEFFYKAEGDADFTSAGTVSAAPNADAVKVVTGLTPETTYSFKVVATDPSSNSANTTITNITTEALYEVRYYFFRGDPATVSLPSTGITSYDLRKGVGTTIENGGGFTHSQKKYYTAFVNGGDWWSFNQNLSSAKDMSEISQAEWYLVVKFRTNISYSNFNIRLNNGISYQNGENLSYVSDGSWNVLTLALADAKNTLSYSASQSGRVLQFHADGGVGYLDIAYAYLTSNSASVDDLADTTVPVIASVAAGSETTSSVVLTVTASDDSGEDITYIVKEGSTVLTSTPATGTSGAATAITVSGLAGQNHTLTVIARDGAGNEASQNTNVTLLESDTPPHDLEVSTTYDDRSVTFTMTAEDNNAALTFAILDANNADAVLADNIAGTAGSPAVYKLTGLTAETDYSFKVRVTDNGSNTITSNAINVTTAAFVAHRFYLLRGDNSGIPSSGDFVSTYVDCNVDFGNSARDARITDYVSAQTSDTWISISLKPKSTVPNEIDDDWYIVVRFRANLSHNVFGFNNFRLNLSNNAENWYVNSGDGGEPFGVPYNSNQWITLKKRIDSRRAGSAITSGFITQDQVAVQLHVSANLIAGENLDIDYAYFTDDISELDEGTQFGKRFSMNEEAAPSFDISNGSPADIDLKRSFTADGYWYTLCLPMDMNAEQVADAFGSCRIAKLNGSVLKSADALYLDFVDVTTIEAGMPYLFMPYTDITNPLLAGTLNRKDAAQTHTPAAGYASMVGTYSPTALAGTGAYILTDENTLAQVSEGELLGTRAYFNLSTDVPAGTPARVRFATDTATDVQHVATDKHAEKQLINGHLYIRRGEQLFTTSGLLVK